jgi:hypothetical protein
VTWDVMSWAMRPHSGGSPSSNTSSYSMAWVTLA